MTPPPAAWPVGPGPPMAGRPPFRRGASGGGVTPQRVLIVNPFGIGDVLFTTPVIRALRQAWPQAYLAFLGNRRTEPLLRHNPHVNEVVVFEKDEFRQCWRHESPWACLRRLWAWVRELRAKRFELALDFSFNSRVGFLLWLMGIPRRVGFDYRRRGLFLTERVPLAGFDDKPVVDYYFDLLAELGITAADRHLEVVVPPELQRWAQKRLREMGIRAGEALVGLIPGGGASWGTSASLRRWHAEGFAAVAQRLKRRPGMQLLLFGDHADRELCPPIVSLVPDIHDLCDQLSLMEFVALLAQCRVVVCNDGGPLHLAVAVGTRTVSVFGPVSEQVYGPYAPDGAHRVISYDPGCRPCYQRFHLPPCPIDRECLRRITADDVARAAEELLAA
ncbi:MAG: glycosyltransferase family 9 protein [Candidatus Omnitrophica bacterium]|nr:glycosyltransferase family 9 protein [Candidatus Omnitrophota bacterium]